MPLSQIEENAQPVVLSFNLTLSVLCFVQPILSMKSFRQRLKGWRLARYIERQQYHVLCRKRIRIKKRCLNKRSSSVQRMFQLLPGEEFLAEICYERRTLNVGNSFVVCPKGAVIINLPQIFDFEKNYVESSKVVTIFRRAVEYRAKISYINFEQVKEISPACIMVFMSYADIWKSYAPRVQTKTQTWSPSVVQAFDEIGFFTILGFKPPQRLASEEVKRTYMPIIAHNVIAGDSVDIGHLTIDIQKQIEAFFNINLDAVRLYDSVTEAIANVYGHAYKNMSDVRLPFRWWMSVSYDTELSELGVILFDHGHGIPSTMKHSTKFDIYRQMVNKIGGNWSEQFRLSVAFERERRKNRGNQSSIQGRGHGCPDMLRLVSQEDQNEVKTGSRFNVISGNARYRYEENKNSNRGVSESLKNKLQGTLIEWRIKL